MKRGELINHAQDKLDVEALCPFSASEKRPFPSSSLVLHCLCGQRFVDEEENDAVRDTVK
jgi:hypothetical protein